MVKSLAYLLFALTIAGGILYFLLTERARERAVLDRRLAGFSAQGADTVKLTKPITVPEMLAPVLAQAQLEITQRSIQLMAAGMLIAVGLALFLLGPAPALALLVGLPMAGLGWLRARARKRSDALAEALPYYIDAVRQLQSVGNSLSQALERALVDAPEIVQSYFAPAVRRLEMGAPIGDTLQQLANRLRIAEVSMLAAAILTNLRFGGSVGTVLTNLTQILRDRVKIRRELNSATSEAKVSAWVLIAMPLLCMAMMFLINPAYITFFMNDERGHTLITIAFTSQALGIVVIRRLMRLEF